MMFIAPFTAVLHYIVLFAVYDHAQPHHRFM